MACTQPCSCCKGACCNGGLCTQATCEDCELAGGTWKGPGTDCEDYDCADGCCEGKTCIDDAGETAYTECVPGYNAVLCTGGSCTPGAPYPSPDTPQCEDGTSNPTSVTGSGADASAYGSNQAIIEEILNNTYNFTPDCCNGGKWNGVNSCSTSIYFPSSDPDWEARVSFPSPPNGSRSAIIEVHHLGAYASIRMGRDDGAYSSSADPCGTTRYDCDQGVSGLVNVTQGTFMDFSSATIDSP